MKQLYSTSIILLFISFTNAQNFSLEWANSMGGSIDDEGYSIATDASGNVYTTGYFKDTVDFDPSSGVFNLISNGLSDIFIQKLDANGNFVWAKQMGGISTDKGLSISIDSIGNVYSTGYFQNTVDFDPSSSIFDLTTNGSYDIYIQKLDANGNFVWVKQIGGLGDSDFGKSITIDAGGNIYTTGSFQFTVDFDPGPGVFNLSATLGSTNMFIQKLDNSGNFIWAKSVIGTGDISSNCITIDVSGDVYTIGSFQNTADFNPNSGIYNLTSTGIYDIFIQKLDANGNFIWAKSMVGTVANNGFSLKLDSSGNIYTTGGFMDIVDFNPNSGLFNLTSNGNFDIYIQKLDANGNFLWAKSFGGTGIDLAKSLFIDASGNIYNTGRFQNTVDFDPSSGVFNLISNGGLDIYIQKLDANGNFIWAKSMGGTANDYGSSIIADAGGNIYTTGCFNDTVDFDSDSNVFNLASNGNKDIFIHKLSQCGNSTSTGFDTQVECGSYTWIDGNTYTSNNITATYTLTNALGCDSVVTLNLTIDTVDIGITNNSPTLSANTSIATFQWLDCDNNFDEINGETSQSFTPASNGNYAVSVTQNGCTDTSSCESVNNVHVNEISSYNLTVHPNPTNDQITIDINGYNGPVNVEVYDLQGRLLESTNTTTVSLRKYERGIYIFKISYGEITEEVRVVRD